MRLNAANDNVREASAVELDLFDSGAPVVILYALAAIVAAIFLWSWL